jgi:hypothetical protein
MRVRRADNDPDRVVVYWGISDNRGLVEIELSLAEAGALQQGRRDLIPGYFRRQQLFLLDDLDDDRARDLAELDQIAARMETLRDRAWLEALNIQPPTDERA